MSDIARITAYRKMRNMGVNTVRQAITLLAINYQSSITTTDLSRVVGSSRASTNQLTVQLKEKGLIDWTSKNQGRGKHGRVYFLTPKGKDAIEQARTA